MVRKIMKEITYEKLIITKGIKLVQRAKNYIQTH
jgi:hypothetical protein